MKDYLLYLEAQCERPLINSPLRVRFHFFFFFVASSNSTVIKYFSTSVELPFYRTRNNNEDSLVIFSNLSFDLVPLHVSSFLCLSSLPLCPFDLIKQVNKYLDGYIYIYIYSSISLTMLWTFRLTSNKSGSFCLEVHALADQHD